MQISASSSTNKQEIELLSHKNLWTKLSAALVISRPAPPIGRSCKLETIWKYVFLLDWKLAPNETDQLISRVISAWGMLFISSSARLFWTNGQQQHANINQYNSGDIYLSLLLLLLHQYSVANLGKRTETKWRSPDLPRSPSRCHRRTGIPLMKLIFRTS